VSGTWVVKRAVSTKPGMLVYIMVDSIAATTEAIVREGGAIMREHTPEIAQFRDLAGNILGLYQEPGS
jgi:predicted enzyme related to lactoylglutathione lyase